MKRIGYIFDQTISIENLRAAHFDGKKAIMLKPVRKRRNRMRRAMAWEADIENNLERLHAMLEAGTYHPGEYRKKIVLEAWKWREIWYTTEWDDQVVQRAIMRTLGVKLEKSMISGTYASMKNRGIHRAIRHMSRKIRKTLFPERLWIYQSDFKKYYASIQHDRLKYRTRSKIKDARMLNLLDIFIDSFPCREYLLEHPGSEKRGIPIGNVVSPLFANFFLDEFDHWAKEVFKATGYYRYADDIVAIFQTKDGGRDFRTAIHRFATELDLTIKPNEKLYPFRARRIDFVGYLISPFSVKLRKSNERKFRRCAKLFLKHPTKKLAESLSSRWGWIKHLSKGGRLWYSVLPKSIHQIHKEASQC